MPVLDIESLDFGAVILDDDPPVGQDPINIENQQADRKDSVTNSLIDLE
jgi:hypothetical protein